MRRTNAFSGSPVGNISAYPAQERDFASLAALVPNQGKELAILVNGKRFLRLPVRTHVIVAGERIEEVVRAYVADHLLPGDIVCVSEKVVSICQGRAFPVAELRPGRLARLLSRFVTRTKHGIGLGCPETMHLAIGEVGMFRILVAAIAAALTKPFGLRGVFYRVAGRQAAAIDGPTPYTLPPYNTYASLGPAAPEGTATKIANAIGTPTAIIDANDLGVEVLGASPGVSTESVKSAFRDNPLGQASQQTPIAILREI